MGTPELFEKSNNLEVGNQKFIKNGEWRPYERIRMTKKGIEKAKKIIEKNDLGNRLFRFYLKYSLKQNYF